ETSSRQMTFHAGMEGLKKSQVGKAKIRIWDALEKAAIDGVPYSTLQASLRDIRFQQREITSGGLPYGLHLLLNALPFEMNGGDILQAFDAEPILQQLDEAIKDPEFFKGLVRSLLDNPTRLESTVFADAHYDAKRIKQETANLAHIESHLSAENRIRIEQESAELQLRQRQVMNKDVLPRIRPTDVSPLAKPSFPVPEPEQQAVILPISSNGISYASILFDISDFSTDEWCWLNLYASLLPDLGVASKTYAETSAWRQNLVPDFDVNLDVHQVLDTNKPLQILVEFCAKGLKEEQDKIKQALLETISGARFDELERITFLIDSMVQDVQNDLAEDGKRYAALAASAPWSRIRQFEESVFGTTGLPFFVQLQQQIGQKEGIRAIAQRLKTLHEKIISSPATVIVAAEADVAPAFAQSLTPTFSAQTRSLGVTSKPASALPANTALHASAQINHCFAVWPGPTIAEPDAAFVSVLAELLTNEVLHRTIREEGGAYGGQVSHALDTGIFTMMSYRDPRLSATYSDFEQAITWVLESELNDESVEEAIICVLQGMDKPQSPYREAVKSWSRKQIGVTDAMRTQYRLNVLRCSSADLKTAARKWLFNKTPSRAAFVGKTEQDMAGLDMTNLSSFFVSPV
ncbi:MAG: peptidase M16, partial [bacterium]